MECMGGVTALCDKAEEFVNRGDYRFAATLLAHAVAAHPDDDDPSSRPKLLLASAYEKLGYGAENATWRNFYLTGAQELRTGKKAGMVAGGKTVLGLNLSISQWFDLLSVQLDGERAAEASFTIQFDVTDTQQKWQLIISNGVLNRRLLQPNSKESSATLRPDLKMILTRTELLDALRGKDIESKTLEGRIEVLYQLLDLTSVSQGSARGPSQL